MNQTKIKQKGKTGQTEKINKQVPSKWYVHCMFVYGDIPDPLKMYNGKGYVEKSIEQNDDEVKWLYETFPQQPVTEHIDVLKREHEVPEKYHISLKEFNDS